MASCPLLHHDHLSLCLCSQLQHPSACCVCRQHAASSRYQAVHWPNPYKPPPLRRQAAAWEDQAGTRGLLKGHQNTAHGRVSSVSVGLMEVVRMWWVSIGVYRRSLEEVTITFGSSLFTINIRYYHRSSWRKQSSQLLWRQAVFISVCLGKSWSLWFHYDSVCC